jgi:pimeloyl-ACP methyl ester carboxylesterase
MPFLDRDGVTIYYEVSGSGPALLLSHGYSSSSHMWDGQRDAFGKHFTLITWDMRGHGKSDYPDDPAAYSQVLTVGDMAAILDATGFARAIVGGLSLGGFMSLAFHAAHRERVRALLIIDTGPGFRNDEARAGWNDYAIRTAEGFEADGLSRLAGRSREMNPAVHRDATGLARAARGMLTQQDASVINSLTSVAVPSLIVVGANDKPFLAASEYMTARIPGAAKIVIPDAGHAVNIDQPQAFNSAVLAFLAEKGLTT